MEGIILLGFGLCRPIELLEHAVRINWASACRPGWVVGESGWSVIWAGGGGVDAGFVVGQLVRHLRRGTAFIMHLLTWRGFLEGCPSSSVGLEGGGSWYRGVSKIHYLIDIRFLESDIFTIWYSLTEHTKCWEHG